MQKKRVGVCIEDAEYESRFTNCLMNHYRNQLELHIYTGLDQLLAMDSTNMDAIIMSDCIKAQETMDEIVNQLKVPIIYLLDFEEEKACFDEKEGTVIILEKYQEVNYIIDEILKNIGNEIRDVKECGRIRVKTRVAAVYSLSENEFQLPFTVTLGSILNEKERVLVVDLQENSGLTQLTSREDAPGLEELMIMAESGKYSYGRMASCIGHMDGIDYIYPMVNSESLCELNASICLKLIQLLCQELDYDVILINLGARFLGFYEVLNKCQDIYLMQKKGGLYQWRELEFLSELSARGYKQIIDKIIRIDIPVMTNPITSCERLIEQWRWNEFGDLIRNVIPGATAIG